MGPVFGPIWLRLTSTLPGDPFLTPFSAAFVHETMTQNRALFGVPEWAPFGPQIWVSEASEALYT